VAELSFHAAETAQDKAAVLRLRDAVYVQDQGRLADAADMAATFDRFDRQAVYLLAERDGVPVGTIKLIADSEAGLPCEEAVDLTGFRPGKRLVEYGHLLTLPSVRDTAVATGLMREALVYSVGRLGATHVLGDFFIDGTGSLRAFYTYLGFEPLGEPYRDERFQDAPLSVVAVLDLADAAGRCERTEGRRGELLRYFFHDYHRHATRAEA
jgi:putrescine aminotransferase